MRVYISGQITGLPIEEAQKNFQEVEDLLTAHGFDAVNPFKVAPYNPE